MKLEAVIISVDYSDFLSHTLPYNKNLFDKIVVVTDSKDLETKKVCDFWNVECVVTDDFYLDSEKANKGVGVNKGLEKLNKDGWVVQLDADIWLPPLFREIIEKYPLENDSIYGIDRLMCESYEDWYDFLYNYKKPVHDGWIYLHTDLFSIGTRLIQYKGEGYMPIGFFQLWNPKGSGIYIYPSQQVGYDRSDVVHLKQWARKKRKFIPDLLCVHLSNEKHGQGQNWSGRNTKEFKPNKIESKISSFLKRTFSVFIRIYKFFQRICKPDSYLSKKV